MDTFIEFLRKPIFKRLFIFVILGIVAYLLRGLATLLLLTFVFIYVFNSLQNIIYRFVSRFFRIKRLFITILLYILFISLFAVFARIYVPILINQISALVKNITSYLLNFKTTGQQNNLYSRVLDYLLNNVDLSKYVSSGGSTLLTLLSNIGTVGLYIFLSLILSLLFMIEKKNVGKFVGRFKQSKLYWMYEDIRYFFKKFARSFGKVIQNQILIAFINAAISVVILMILGFHNYLGLGLMVFILGMVPVAGVIVSLIPLSIIAYSSGGLTKVIYVLILIAVLHSLETYVLNPKLMSRTSKMPVFCTLLVLLISEHFLGIWGLIVGLPLTMFILDVLDVIPSD